MPVHAEQTSDNRLNVDISAIDAAHIHFREKEFPGGQTYRCFSCSECFQAESILNILEHYARCQNHKRFHSACLYCGGKVHKYVRESNTKHPAIDEDINFYHDCGRWKRKEDL